MQDDKKQEIRKNLENFQQQLEDLKLSNPEGDYHELEVIIKRLNDMLDGVDKKNYFIKAFLKGLMYIVILYLVDTISICVVLGFGINYFGIVDVTRLVYIIPLVSLIMLVVHKIVEAVVSTLKKSPLLNLFLLNLIFVVVMAILDTLCFHICTNFWQAVIALFFANAISIFGEYYISSKIIL